MRILVNRIMIDQHNLFISAPVLDRHSELIAAQSTRHGGISPAPYKSLNLGLYTPDAEEHVRANRQRFFQQLGLSAAQAAGARQVHGDEILRVHKPGEYEGYDALITDQPGVALTVTVADCCPVLLFDPRRQVIGAVHAGWRGTVLGIAGKTVRQLIDQFAADPQDMQAYVGACIDRSSYEVDADVADHFAQAYKLWDPDRGKYYLDIKKANRDQLLDAGIPGEHIGLSPWCTVRNNDHFFSHRHERGQTGRGLAVIAMKST